MGTGDASSASRPALSAATIRSGWNWHDPVARPRERPGRSVAGSRVALRRRRGNRDLQGRSSASDISVSQQGRWRRSGSAGHPGPRSVADPPYRRREHRCRAGRSGEPRVDRAMPPSVDGVRPQVAPASVEPNASLSTQSVDHPESHGRTTPESSGRRRSKRLGDDKNRGRPTSHAACATRETPCRRLSTSVRRSTRRWGELWPRFVAYSSQIISSAVDESSLAESGSSRPGESVVPPPQPSSPYQ